MEDNVIFTKSEKSKKLLLRRHFKVNHISKSVEKDVFTNGNNRSRSKKLKITTMTGSANRITTKLEIKMINYP